MQILDHLYQDYLICLILFYFEERILSSLGLGLGMIRRILDGGGVLLGSGLREEGRLFLLVCLLTLWCLLL
jgi:hypothetical protein